MKANEFVKKFGWDYAIKFLNYSASIAEDRCILDFGEYYYLKRIVESHELVDVEGGIDQVKDTFSFAFKHGADELTEYGKRLKQAIADVESCQ